MFTLPGRASLAELIVHALNESGADGIGRVLSYDEGRADPRTRGS